MAKRKEEPLKNRGSNFTLEEVEALQSAVAKNAKNLFDKDVNPIYKKFAITQVYMAVAEVSTTKRSLDSIRNRLRSDVKVAKKKKSEIKKSFLKTGGGPDTAPTLTPYEELLTSFIPDVQMEGIPKGIDTSKPNVATDEEPPKKKHKFQPPIRKPAAQQVSNKKDILEELGKSDSSAESESDEDPASLGDDYGIAGYPFAIQVNPNEPSTSKHIIYITESQEEALKDAEQNSHDESEHVIDLENLELDKSVVVPLDNEEGAKCQKYDGTSGKKVAEKETPKVDEKKKVEKKVVKKVVKKVEKKVEKKEITAQDIYEQQNKLINAVENVAATLSSLLELVQQKFS